MLQKASYMGTKSARLSVRQWPSISNQYQSFCKVLKELVIRVLYKKFESKAEFRGKKVAVTTIHYTGA